MKPGEGTSYGYHKGVVRKGTIEIHPCLKDNIIPNSVRELHLFSDINGSQKRNPTVPRFPLASTHYGVASRCRG
jgi:hypothetical protein